MGYLKPKKDRDSSEFHSLDVNGAIFRSTEKQP